MKMLLIVKVVSMTKQDYSCDNLRNKTPDKNNLEFYYIFILF